MYCSLGLAKMTSTHHAKAPSSTVAVASLMAHMRSAGRASVSSVRMPICGKTAANTIPTKADLCALVRGCADATTTTDQWSSPERNSHS